MYTSILNIYKNLS